MHFDAALFDQFFECERISSVAVKSISFFDQHNTTVALRFEQVQHLRKLFATRIFRGLNVNEFMLDV